MSKQQQPKTPKYISIIKNCYYKMHNRYCNGYIINKLN